MKVINLRIPNLAEASSTAKIVRKALSQFLLHIQFKVRIEHCSLISVHFICRVAMTLEQGSTFSDQ
jgi:hypothetical protein